MADIIQVKRGTAAQWAAQNPVLAQGELGLDLNSWMLKVGDGVTPWNGLAYLRANLPEDFAIDCGGP